MARCMSCGAAISWIRTPKGSYMPVNEGTVPYVRAPGGTDNIVTKIGSVLRCHIQEQEDEDTTGFGYVPHWATCTSPDKHRRKP